jgi:hypothetical protein
MTQAMRELPMDTPIVKGPSTPPLWSLLGLGFGMVVLMTAAAVALLGWYRSASLVSVADAPRSINHAPTVSPELPALPLEKPSAAPVAAANTAVSLPMAAPTLVTEKAGLGPAPVARAKSSPPKPAAPGLSPNLPFVPIFLVTPDTHELEYKAAQNHDHQEESSDAR